ncbi:Tolllike receptor 6, partial [Caligus rogercresseyi]
MPSAKSSNALTSLSIVSSGSLKLESERAFQGLESLRALNLSHNNLWSVPSGAFCRLPGLNSLNLSFNRLQDLLELSFSPSKDATLVLSDNSLLEIPSRALSQLSKLETLDLSSNSLNLVQDNAFDNLRDLKKLSLASNRLIALPPNTFAPTQNLVELHLQNNSLGVLAPQIFNGLSRLLVLNVSRNELGTKWLTPSLFSSLLRLVSLDLSHNRIASLDPAVLVPLNSLQILDLSTNHLTALDSGTFVSQNNLHILQLSHNNLQTIHPRALDGLSVVSSINADHNELSELEANLFSECCSTLKDLTLSNNKFLSVPKGLRHLDGLRTLDLGGNAIKQLSNESFIGLRALYGLRLASNGISEIQGSISRVFLVCSISSLDHGVFNELSNLKILRLDRNELNDINGLLSGQEELQWLNWFDYAFIPKNLELLDIHGNQIEKLGNYYKLSDQFELKTLDASHNKIKKLETLSLPKSIQVANLGHNRIRSLAPGTFRDKKEIRVVDLSHNYLKRLQINSLNMSPRSESTQSIIEGKHLRRPRPHFYFGHNPLTCDCEMEWLKNLNANTNIRLPLLMDPASTTCSGDPSTSILNIPREHFLCQYEAHCFRRCMCCDFFACDCRMQCPEGCDCYHDSSWSVNVIQCSRRNHALVPPLIPMDATDIYMDGNNFTGLLDTQSFIGRKRISSMFLNNSNIGGIDNQTFNGLTELKVLHLEDNLIQRLEGHEFANITSLRELYLHSNRISYISERTFDNLIYLSILTLDRNELVSTSIWEFPLSSLQDLHSVTLANNPWSCKCKFVQKFQNFISENREVFSDVSEASCLFEDGISSVSLARNLTCSESMAVVRRSPEERSLYPHWRNIIPTIIIVSAIFLILAILLIILFAFRTPLRVWLHSKYGIRICDSRKDAIGGNDKLYDAFVSYSLKDDEFLHSIILPQLEARNGTLGYKLCLQHRDLRSGASISETFPSASHLCSQHILLVSKSYLDTEWPQIKFVLPKKWSPLIVLIEELTSLDLAAVPEFNLLTKTSAILRFYLPDASEYRHHCVSPPPEINGMKISYPPTASGWHYDGLINSNNSSSTSTRSTVAGGSPRNTDVGSDDAIQILNNPMENVHPWEHTYQSIGSDQQGGHIYHTLEPAESTIQVDDSAYDALGTLDVMLPNGQM